MSKRIDLNGVWKLRWCDGQRGDRLPRLLEPKADLSRAWDASVPGEVHATLVKHGVIAEPTVGLNCLQSRWVEETVWHYRRAFRAPKLGKGERAWLVFEGLDLDAVIHLNGKEIGRHNNSFCPCKIDVTQYLQSGENIILVALESGLFGAADKACTGYEHHLEGRLTKRVWLRKTQSSHGWDWSPRLLNVGIHGDVYLEIARDARWDALVVLSDLGEDLHEGSVTARIIAEGLGSAPVQGLMTVSVAGTGHTARTPVTIAPGLNRLEARVTVAHPRLWWPAGHGAQHRYRVTVALSMAGRTIGRETRQIGFRHVRVNQDSHPERGRYFVIEVNRKPIFCKGGNFVPADIIFARIDARRYRKLIDRAIESHCNFMRIWGGGLYEGAAFYEACDARGVLVWQEFIFACGRYPATDERFYHSVKQEATHQIRRLAHHPSLIVWCGNNEMEWGGWSWGWDKGVTFPDYALFHRLFPILLKEEDGTRFYQPSSPFSPDHVTPNDDHCGDQHPWSIGFGDTDFRKYRAMTCRFSDEGGILGPNALKTVRACLPKGMDRPGSFAWEYHDNSVSYWGGGTPFPDSMLEQWLGRPLASMSIADYVYWGGVVQGLGLAEYAKNFRRRMFDSAAAVFWMYNDCWPTVRSWTIVDYYLRRTPAFWPVRRAFAPVTAVVTREANTVRVYGVNDGDECAADLRYGLLALAGRYPLDLRKHVMLRANASTLLAEFPAAQWDALGVRSHVAFALLSIAGVEIARDCLVLPYFKEMQWPHADVRVALRDGKAVFTSKTFAWRVCLDLDGERALPDNFFDVYPGVATVLDWPKTLGPPRIIRVGNDR